MKTQTTVVAVYRNLSDAKAAAAELTVNGFPARDIYIQSGATGVTDPSQYSEERPSHHEAGITGWFKSLFGSDERTAEQRDYENAFTSGNTILSVDTSDQKAELAADILNRHSPVNVHEEAGGASTSTAAGTSVGTRGSIGSPPPRQSSSGTQDIESQSALRGGEQSESEMRPVVRGGVRLYSRTVEARTEEDRTSK
jgi:hypothetical protein